MANINYLELLGYLASLLVLISLLMSSIIKLRWINLIGSGTFCIYGLLIGSFPVAFMNLCTCFINIYYLVKIYNTKEYFNIYPFEKDAEYLNKFLDFYSDDISSINDNFKFNKSSNILGFYILRDLVPAGVFICSEYDNSTLKIELDFVTPKYRDFKIGSFIFNSNKDFFKNKGFTKFICSSSNKAHINYLKKMGFTEVTDSNKTLYIKTLS